MDKMVDIHTHILPGVDDGAQGFKESIEIIHYLKNHGIKDIVLTSHYIKNTKYNHPVEEREKILEKLNDKLNDPSIHLYLGNEVFICEDILQLLEKKEITTMNNTKYLLIELPLTTYINQLSRILCDITNYGIVPIIAHPERYQFLQKDPQRISELLEFGCLLQCNIDSLIDKYGTKAKKLAKWLIKNDLVQFVATDTHYVGNDKKLNKAYQKLKKLVGEEKFQQLTYTNPIRILQNQTLDGNLEYLIQEEERKKKK